MRNILRVKNFLRLWKDSIEWIIFNKVISSFPSQSIRIFLLKIFGANIGRNVAIYGGCEYRSPKFLKIGFGTSIGHRAILDARCGLTIGENVCFGTEVMIWTLHHDYNDVGFKAVGNPVIINDYVWLGSRCIILPGVIIGEGAVIASGAVVTKNVESYTVVAGIPAKEISKRDRINYNYMPGNYKLHGV